MFPGSGRNGAMKKIREMRRQDYKNIQSKKSSVGRMIRSICLSRILRSQGREYFGSAEGSISFGRIMSLPRSPQAARMVTNTA